MKTLLVRTVGEWRDWLEEHHAAESEVWLIFHKQHTGVRSIDRSDALDEALCFGWVDSLTGLERPPTDRGYDPRPERLPMPSKLPSYVLTALKKHPAALRHFEALSPAQRRRYFAWIESAKREETKQRRLEEAIRLLAAGKELGLK